MFDILVLFFDMFVFFEYVNGKCMYLFGLINFGKICLFKGFWFKLFVGDC